MDNKQAALALGQKPVGQLLWQYALPAIVAMTASSLYNIIDRAMIGQIVGPEAIAGLGITFPFMNLSAAFGAAVGVGSSTCISVKLGQRDYDTAQHLLGNTVTLNLIIGFVFMVICLLFLDPILLFFGASEACCCYCSAGSKERKRSGTGGLTSQLLLLAPLRGPNVGGQCSSCRFASPPPARARTIPFPHTSPHRSSNVHPPPLRPPTPHHARPDRASVALD